MSTLYARLNHFDQVATRFLARYSIPVLRIAMGVVFIWFGAPKFVPGLSPAEDLARRTVDVLTMGLMPHVISRVLLATLECAIGLGLISGVYLRLTLALLAFQMLGTLAPLVLFPAEVFTSQRWVPTLEGQYILKNMVLIGAGMVLGATVRGGGIVAEAAPESG